jgi:FAD/FMN-containing dehydrogenase
VELTADQHPAAVVVAASAEDIAETVRFAFDNGYGVTAQGTATERRRSRAGWTA